MLIKMKTDADYAEKIIKSYERRKVRAVFFGVASLIFGAFACISYMALDDKTHEITGSITSMLIEGRVLTENDIKLVKTNNQLSYIMGMRIGQLVNTFATAAGLSIGYCLYLLFWSRKERIIKELYEKEKM